jgi:hypothetical protein
MDGGSSMTAPYVFHSSADEAVFVAAMRAKGPVLHARGDRTVKFLHLLHCILLVWGGIALGYGVTHLLTGTPTLMHWSTVLGLGLAYVAVFGSIFITLPVMARRMLAARANQGTVEMVVHASGVQTKGKHYRSSLDWSGFEAVTRSKLGFVLWFAGNRPSIPFTAFESPAQIDAFEADVKTWLEASR